MVKRAARRPGRPPSEQAPGSRQALIDAARDLFSRHGFDQVSTKRLADAAGVHPAMIHYHFGDKAGLLEAAFREAIAPVVEELAALSESVQREQSLRRFFGLYMRTLANNPWLPKMIVRDVLPEGGRLQALAVRELGAHVGPVVRKLVAEGQARGELRGELNPLLTTLSVASLAVFPFLSFPITGRVLAFQLDEKLVRALIEHTADLFYRGAGADGHASS